MVAGPIRSFLHSTGGVLRGVSLQAIDIGIYKCQVVDLSKSVHYWPYIAVILDIYTNPMTKYGLLMEGPEIAIIKCKKNKK